jgi:transketolase
VPISALHLTRPGIEIPDREKLGMPSHFAAAKGAYIIRDYQPGQPKAGAVIVRGTSAVANLLKILPDIDANGYNVKIVCATSSELFDRQPDKYRNMVLTDEDRMKSMIITTQSRSQMQDWIFHPELSKYALSADWDDCWRTGGTLEEVLDEAHLSPEWILNGISRFVKECGNR